MNKTGSHFTDELKTTDPHVANLIDKEKARQNLRLELIASMNFMSAAQLEAQGSLFNNSIVEGYPGERLHGPSLHADDLEKLAIKRACKLFNAEYANVQPHSGTQANQAVFLATLAPGDIILSMSLTAGGHFSHSIDDNISAKWLKAAHYGASAKDALIDYDEVEKLAQKHRPKLLIAGGSAYPRKIDFERMASIAHAVGAKFMVDVAHVAGLIVTGLYPNPLPHADVVTTTTYKNLRGAQGGLILSNNLTLAKKIDEAVCPGIQGVPLMHVIAAKAVAFGEALKPDYKAYCNNVLANAKSLGSAIEDRGIPLLTGGTDTSFIVADIRSTGITAPNAVSFLDKIGIGANAVFLPGDPPDFAYASALRLGSAAITTRGMGEEQCDVIAHIITDVLKAMASDSDAVPTHEAVIAVKELCNEFPIY